MNNTIIKEIECLQKKRTVLCALQKFPGCKFLREKCDSQKDIYINNLLDDIIKNNGLYKKYINCNISNLNKIGNRIWMFWYTGFDTAPPIVQKCVSIAHYINNAEIILLDKNNLEKFFIFEGRIKELFETKSISIQTFSDILRCQLLSKYGGFWFDATLWITRKDIVQRYGILPFWSIKHSENNLLLKQKWNEYFTKGMWSIYGCAAGKDNPIFSFIYDTYISYFNSYNTAFHYFQTDYTWLYAYNHFNWAKELIYSVSPSVSCSYFMGQNLTKHLNRDYLNHILGENEFQKLNWRINKKSKKAKKSYYDYFIEQPASELIK